jgi:hypothetical protein
LDEGLTRLCPVIFNKVGHNRVEDCWIGKDGKLIGTAPLDQVKKPCMIAADLVPWYGLEHVVLESYSNDGKVWVDYCEYFWSLENCRNLGLGSGWVILTWSSQHRMARRRSYYYYVPMRIQLEQLFK